MSVLAILLTIGVGNAWGASATWTKVISEPADWSGEYLVVYNSQAYDGSLTSDFDAANNYQSVTITNNKITLDDQYSITIASPASGYYSVKTAAGYYIGRKDNSNGMDASTTYNAANHKNTITWNSTNKNVKIAGPGGRCLGNNSGRWRFFGSTNGYVNVDLYKKDAGGSSGTCTWDLSIASYNTPTSHDLVTWSHSAVTMTNAKSTSGTIADNYLGGDANSRTSSRFYTDHVLTITPATDYSITSVVFTATSDNYANALGNSTWTNAGAEVSSTTVTVTPTNGANAFSAEIGGTCGFTEVVVSYTYTGAGATFTVTYNANNATSGSVPTDATAYSSGSTVTVKGNTGSLARTGYTFGGWNTQANGNGTNYTAGSGTFTISANTTLYAKWTANTISLTLNKNNSDASGSNNGSASVKYDATSLTSISHATRTGYSIEGYYAEVGCTNKVLSNTGALVNYSGYVVSSKWARATTPTTLYAKWTVNSYTLTWNLNGGTVTVAGTGAAVNATGSPSSSINYGATITAPTVTKEGNTFAGWNTTPANTMPNANTTYTAQWTPNQYTVTWKSNGSIVRTDNNVNHGTAATPPTISPLPCGDKFVGWTDATDGAYVHNTSTLYTSATITITGNKTFYAVFADYDE